MHNTNLNQLAVEKKIINSGEYLYLFFKNQVSVELKPAERLTYYEILERLWTDKKKSGKILLGAKDVAGVSERSFMRSIKTLKDNKLIDYEITIRKGIGQGRNRFWLVYDEKKIIINWKRF